jgi:hypothetical protein
MKKLSHYQIVVLREALEYPVIERRSEIPNGVYRSLVCRGCLMTHRLGYSITPTGYDIFHYATRRLRRAA